nr:MAG TPA: acetyltransferase [Caudoviricetes sp.]
MKTLIFNVPAVNDWVSSKIYGRDRFPPDAPSIGLLENGRIVGGVVYTMYTGNGIMMNVAGGYKGWINRAFIRAAFAYPFKQLGCTRVSGLVRVDNFAAQQFDERLGFKREGLVRRGDDDGTDLIMYGMLREECKWIK